MMVLHSPSLVHYPKARIMTKKEKHLKRHYFLSRRTPDYVMLILADEKIMQSWGGLAESSSAEGNRNVCVHPTMRTCAERSTRMLTRKIASTLCLNARQLKKKRKKKNARQLCFSSQVTAFGSRLLALDNYFWSCKPAANSGEFTRLGQHSKPKWGEGSVSERDFFPLKLVNEGKTKVTTSCYWSHETNRKNRKIWEFSQVYSQTSF